MLINQHYSAQNKIGVPKTNPGYTGSLSRAQDKDELTFSMPYKMRISIHPKENGGGNPDEMPNKNGGSLLFH
jgi:hypothetical protein